MSSKFNLSDIEEISSSKISKISDDEDDDDELLMSRKTSKNESDELKKFSRITSDLTGDEFWAVHESQFPKLFKIYSWLKIIQPSSASIERLFSKAKMIFNEKCGQMDVETILYNLIFCSASK